VFRWEQEHFFNRGWVCVGRAGGLEYAGDQRAVECEWLFSREAVEQEGFDPSYASDFWDITNRQDWHACEAVQRGVSSRGYRRGPSRPARTPSTNSSRWWPTATSKAGSHAPPVEHRQ